MNQLKDTISETLTGMQANLVTGRAISAEDIDALCSDLQLAMDEGNRGALETASGLLSKLRDSRFVEARLAVFRRSTCPGPSGIWWPPL
jgi:hypothetical protein